MTYVMMAVFLGMRHGMDSDHVAAIADMVGSESHRKRQVVLGIMYAFGHGFIVFFMGMIAIFIGFHLPSGMTRVIEAMVGCTLIFLGGVMLFSLLYKNEMKSRIKVLYELIGTILRRFQRNDSFYHSHSLFRFGWISAFIIGIIHGIGVESPTQLAILTHTAGKADMSVAALQLSLFVVGLLIATIGMTFCLSWGFMKARIRDSLFFLFGAITSLYSIWLGITIMIETWKGGA
ncbi:nickel transporter [Anoxybacteroides tepidamans]|uniref:nickel transporter n=1 Tax=Anoxybacteroides tepidamans TaxID=265948 RepID=UPI0005513FAA|nr:nickel transporter [Anoxybacillus tepidamans]